jgi:lysophospholipase L1-like esterase
VIDLLHSLQDTPPRKQPASVVIVIGVNDARRRKIKADYLKQWAKDYSTMIDLAKRLSSTVAVSTILPVEDGLPLGSSYFDQGLIEKMNSQIRTVSAAKKVRLIDTSRTFQKVKMGGRYTRDGVHLTSAAYKFYEEGLFAGLGEICSVSSKK